MTVIGRGNKLAYIDSNADAVSLSLTTGVMELTLKANPDGSSGDGLELNLLELDPHGRSTLSGSVKKSRFGGDQKTTLQSINPTSGFVNKLPASFQVVGDKARPDAIDAVLESADFSARHHRFERSSPR